MAVMQEECEQPLNFDDWYQTTYVDERDGCYKNVVPGPWAAKVWGMWQHYKREMDLRVANYHKLEMIADGQVVSTKPDLPNISSGETAGLVRRVARNLVQNCPNVEVVSRFDDDSLEGQFSRFILTTRVIGSDLYSNDMQQNLFASAKTALTLGFDCVIPVLMQEATGSWYMKYDAIHYRDVFPEPGARDVRQCESVFIRRYLTEGDVRALVNDQVPGWDHTALRTMLQQKPPARERQSVDHQTAKHHQTPDGYEIITLYTSSGKPFLTFEGRTKMLLRIEKNKHPLKLHPVHFLVLEKDSQQPLGKSQVELIYGRQDFQDLMLNGAMKMWYRNINPSIIAYGAPNATPNLSPGKYTNISNPNARLEAFEVNTGTLQQYGLIAQQNLGSMVSMIGAADQQMASQAGSGMSATPQGVEAQQAMVDITTNNYQKAIESFFSHYCSYALTLYFQELKSVKEVTPNAETRKGLLEAGLPPEKFTEDGKLEVDFEKLAVEYWVKCVPGSLTELEDEKQLRVLNQLFVPLSQSMPAIAASGDQEMMQQATRAMAYIVGKQIELSGSSSAKDILGIWKGGDVEQVNERDQRVQDLEDSMGLLGAEHEAELEAMYSGMAQMQEQISLLTQNNQLLLERLGVVQPGSTTGLPQEESSPTTPVDTGSTVSTIPA